jgi:hypothetical protein
MTGVRETSFEAPMVTVRDEGSEFDGSIETVWRFLNMPGAHQKTHRSIRNQTSETIGNTTVMYTMERLFMGKWVKETDRVTILPPLGVVSEVVEGPFAGSKYFTVYMPEGDGKTRVDVLGDFKSPVLPPDAVQKSALMWLKEEFDEDAPAIRLLQSGQLDESVIGPEAETQDTAVPVPPSADDEEEDEDEKEVAVPRASK